MHGTFLRTRRRVRLTGAEAGLLPVAAFPSPQVQSTGDAVHKFLEHAPSNLPDKVLAAVVVKYALGGKPPPHRDDAPAGVVGYVLSESIRSQVAGGKTRVYCAGQGWFEPPGAHHVISENASATEPASLLAVRVVDAGSNLTVYDK
jgi:quercetin dioxygenase-like cupin family protein